MALDVVRIRDKNTSHGPFRFAEIRDHEAAHASWWSFDDEQEVRDRHWHPLPGQTVLDIGAAFGSYALPALVRGARVVCFSPAGFDTELLEKNLSLNPALAARCMVSRDGLYSRDGWFDPDRCKFSDSTPEVDAQWLRVRSLDSWLEERPGVGHVHWMKIDVEGAEFEALRGAEKCLRMYRPNILVENHEFQVAGIGAQVRDYLVGLDLGYACDGPHPHGAVSHSFFSVGR